METIDRPYFAEGTPAMLKLEAMVDKVGLSNVLYALAHIAWAKGDHLRANWQDRAAAKVWEGDASKIEKLAARI